MAEIGIRIELDQNGNFTYYPALLHASKGDAIYWTCNNGPFSVSFPERTPFEAVTIPGKNNGHEAPFATESQTILAGGGIFHYLVAVAVSPTPEITAATVYLDGGCPGVEIP